MPTEITARTFKVAVIDNGNGFANRATAALKRIPGVAIFTGPAEDTVAWGAELVVIDVRAGARLLIPPLRDLGIDVLVAAGRPVVSVIDGCPVFDKERVATAMVALVESVRRRRMAAVAAD